MLPVLRRGAGASGSDGARVAPLALRQVGIEGHGGVAHHQPTGGQHLDLALADRQQAVVGHLLELLQGIGEVVAEDDGVLALDGGEVDAVVAHQGVDHVPAQAVVVAQAVAAEHPQAPLAQAMLVLGGLLDVLAVGIAHLADGGDAEADHVAVGVGGVALEVALQGAVLPGQGQLVVGQGEVVHADVDVAGGGQASDGELEQLELALRRRHVLGANQALGLEQLRQVGIAVGGDAVRTQGDDLVEGGIEAGHRLQRQAVDQVDAHRFEARLPGGVHQGDDILLALHAVDRLLHVEVEVLDAEAQAVEAQVMELVDLLGGHGARIHLQGELALGGRSEVEGLVQRRHQLAELGVAQIGRRAAAQVQLGHAPGLVEQRPLHPDLLLEPLEVLGGTLGVVGDDLVAGAVVAEALAEGDMHVDRQRLGRLGPVAALGRGAVVILGEGRMELGRRGVGGIARPGTVILLHQGAIEQQGILHRETAS